MRPSKQLIYTGKGPEHQQFFQKKRKHTKFVSDNIRDKVEQEISNLTRSVTSKVVRLGDAWEVKVRNRFAGLLDFKMI